MQKFLTDLARQIKTAKLTKKNLDPKGDPKECDRVVGILPDEMKRFYAVLVAINAMIRKQDKMALKLKKKLSSGPPKVREVRREHMDFIFQHRLLHRRYKLVTDLFWQGVREAFPSVAFEEESLVLCRNYQVVVLGRLTGCGTCPHRIGEKICML